MFDLDRLQEIWVTITRNRTRSLLTGFGVFWGIFMLMIMMGAGHGLEHGLMENIEGFATNSCFMGSSSTSLPYKGFQRGRNWNIRNRDIDILRLRVPDIDCLSPVLFGGRSENNTVRGDNSGSYFIRGLHANYVRIEQQRMTFGRFINEIDVLQSRKVCVIGLKVYEEMFPMRGNPLGRYLRINGIYYQVVGVSSGVSNVSIGGNSEESISIPFTTLQRINRHGDIIHMLAATAKPGIPASVIESEMKRILKSSNSIAPADTRAIWGFNLEEQFNIFKYLFIGIAAVIWIVGSGTLLAGIIGVSNIMMVTVRERTREIGIRRALGARPRTIIAQIISESLLLTAIAGILGLCTGVLCLYLADVYWLRDAEDIFLSNPMVSFGSAVVSLTILLVSGIIAGSFPAARALKIKAIDAIREE
jgi:putative ABC transport system permease protein